MEMIKNMPLRNVVMLPLYRDSLPLIYACSGQSQAEARAEEKPSETKKLRSEIVSKLAGLK